MGISIEQVAQGTGLSIEEIKLITNNSTATIIELSNQ
jgi:predicted transposase YdaD